MQSFCEAFWNLVGIPLSSAIGAVTDRVPFSTTEVLVWLVLFVLGYGLLSLLRRLRRWWRNEKRPAPTYFQRRLRRGAWTLVLGYAALVYCIYYASYHRLPLYESAGMGTPPEISEAEANAFIDALMKGLLEEFDAGEYAALEDEGTLAAAQRAYKKLFSKLNIKDGRHVRVIKRHTGLTGLVGRAYGGPGYYNRIVVEEAGLATQDEYPHSLFWRHVGIYHEVAHGKGWMREMDAEIVSTLAMLHSERRIDRALARAHIIVKSHRWYNRIEYDVLKDFPQTILEDFRESDKRLRKRELSQPFTLWLRSLGERTGVQNDPKRYGDSRDAFDGTNEYFRALVMMEGKALK